MLLIGIISEKIRQYSGRLLLPRRSRAKTINKGKAASPFQGNRSRYETFVPLLQTFRFVHEPVGVASTTRFVGRQTEMESLAERVLFSEGGSFLVTGYRGVGKTSFINQVVRKLEEALPWAETLLGETEIIDIYLNIARPVQPSEIMHHIIRRLHDRLIEKGIYHLLDLELRDALTLSYHRTSVNMARKLAESSERSFGFNEASIGGDWMKAAVKMSWNSKRNRTQNYEMSFLGYDDKSAEHDIISISRRLTEGYLKPLTRWERLKLPFSRVLPKRVKLKIVFVFDELDKLEEFTAKDGEGQKPAIDQIIGSLKNLFTTSGVTFVFVAGKDLQERWLEDVGRGDSVYESVFSYDKYLPCLWADVDSICDELIDSSRNLRAYANQVFREFKKYLAYKGRGIPRRIIRTFNEYVEWTGDQPVLAFTRQNIRRIRFFAGLQDLLTANQDQLFDDSHEEIPGTQSDKRRLGVYYLIDWILRQGSAVFTLKDVLNASKRLSVKIALAEEIASRVAEKIIRILLDADYIQEVPRSLQHVIIDDANAMGDEPSVEEERYRIAPRRLGEMGDPIADVERPDTSISLSETKLSARRERAITNISKYKIVRKIGEGGMGVVYEATDKYTGRKVAIKTLMYDIDSQLLARFEREAMIMNELNHPNIVRLYDWGNDDGRLYIAMEYLDGITLQEMIHRQVKLDLDLVVAIGMPLMEALDYVHQKGFVRNDIKPTNIILTNKGRVCLVDFGITKPVASNSEPQAKFLTAPGAIVGTPLYMAPEQFRGDTVDERSDIYSLGFVLYEMLTGKLPFSKSSMGALLDAHMHEIPAAPSQHVRLPAAIDRVILKCLAKDPEARFQTMGELAKEFSNAAGEFPLVDLKAVVSVARREVKERRKMDLTPTLPGSDDFSLPRLQLAELPESPESDAIVNSALGLSQLLIDTLSGTVAIPETNMPSAPLFDKGGSTEHGSKPRITLLRGRLEDVDFHLKTLRSGYSLEKKTNIGRNSENDVVLRDAKVSRYHAEFTIDGEDWFIEDLNSSLGTFVNGERIINPRLLKNGDQIGVGDFIFVFNQLSALN